MRSAITGGSDVKVIPSSFPYRSMCQQDRTLNENSDAPSMPRSLSGIGFSS